MIALMLTILAVTPAVAAIGGEVRKVAFMLARGGRFQPAAEAFQGDTATWKFTKPLQVYNETHGIAAGINLNDLGLRDPTRKDDAVWVDPVAGTAVRQGHPAKVEKA